MNKFLSILPALIAIIVSALLGVFISHSIVSAFGWEGMLAAFAMVFFSLFLTFTFFVLGAALLNVLRSGKM